MIKIIKYKINNLFKKKTNSNQIKNNKIFLLNQIINQRLLSKKVLFFHRYLALIHNL
jgi:hypothetical protein